jgi:hypothetical protein
MYVGIIILKHIIVIWEMTCNNESMTSIYFWALQLSSTIVPAPFIGDAALDHQIYTNTTTWIQPWWSPFFAESSPNKYVVVHSQFYLTFITMNQLLPEITYSFVSIQFTPCQPFYDIMPLTNSDAFLYNKLVIFCFIQFFL